MSLTHVPPAKPDAGAKLIDDITRLKHELEDWTEELRDSPLLARYTGESLSKWSQDERSASSPDVFIQRIKIVRQAARSQYSKEFIDRFSREVLAGKEFGEAVVNVMADAPGGPLTVRSIYLAMAMNLNLKDFLERMINPGRVSDGKIPLIITPAVTPFDILFIITNHMGLAEPQGVLDQTFVDALIKQGHATLGDFT